MHDLIEEVLSQARNAWRFRWWGVAAAWGVAVAGWIGVAIQPDVYEASTRILVDSSSVLTPLLGNQIVESDVLSRLDTVRQSLLGRENLEAVAIENDLDATAISDADRDRVLDGLASTVEISAALANPRAPIGSRDSVTAFTITYSHTDPRTAVGVVTSFKDILIEKTLAGNTAESELAGTFFEQQIAANSLLLEQAKQARLDFLREHADSLPSSGGGIQERTQRELEALADANREKRLAESGLAELQRKLSGEAELVPGDADLGNRAPPPGSLDDQIRIARAEYERLARRYTDAVPQVRDAKSYLEELEAERAELLRARGVLDPEQELSSLSTNSVHEEIRIAITETEVKIAQLSQDIEDREKRIAELQSQLTSVLAVEQELDGLNGDIEGYEETGRALATAQQRQRLTDQATATDPAHFLIPNPPRAGTDPVAPKRLLLLAGVFAAALGTGGGLCWLLAQLKPVFSTARVLREVVGIPVLGCVGHVTLSRAAKSRQRWSFIGFAGAMTCLVLVFGGGVLFEVAGPGIRSLLGAV
jgi:polysaccharide chain length determinant protein (PEP-CTERM system associated)